MDSPTSSMEDEAALLAILDDVWIDQIAPSTPLTLPALPDQTPQNDTIPVSTVNKVSATKPRKKRRRDRNRPWHEIAQLQAESKNLEQEIENRLAKSSKKARSAFYKHTRNMELKMLLRETMEETQAFEQNLERQVDKLMRMASRSLGLPTMFLAFDPIHDVLVFSKMAQRVDDQYNDMGRVLQRMGLEGDTSEITDAYVCRANSLYPRGSDGDILKFRSRMIKPFNKSTLEKGFWRYMDTLGVNQATTNLELGLASRVAVQKFESVAGDYVCTTRVITKQFVEEDRIVQVWNMLIDWQKFGEEMRNVQTYEHGWGFIQSMANNSANRSICGGCIIMRPVVNESDETLKALSTLYQDMLMSRVHALDNKAMDQFLFEKGTRAPN
ncbi:hypothetical protein PHMEG_00017325 [Phytophthora megakarya]|uniref:M96 mating-specific protein n=1 Tax=Phytophthora megakarya TaxID=4795 RepID=A0A225VYN6_9STRA|nr:hypothetical protein PHMEG_00017325 [Phytophthora megakarya]